MEINERTVNKYEIFSQVPTFIPIFIMGVAIFLSVVPIVTDPSPKYLFAIGFILLGVAVYYFFIYKNNRPKIMGK